jgi:NAD(P)-dependent dehydrogenase (short-subunit alcohol dehydrogenase family)
MAKNIFDLTGRVALVTGASRGLGQSFARALADAGADLVVTARKRENCEPFADEIRRAGRRVACLALDVRDEASVRQMGEDAPAALGKVDILVNNAGCNVRKPSLQVTWDDWNTVLDTNLRGAFFVSQVIARHMTQQNYGRIIHIGSLTTVFGYAGIGPYCASRGGASPSTAWHPDGSRPSRPRHSGRAQSGSSRCATGSRSAAWANQPISTEPSCFLPRPPAST